MSRENKMFLHHGQYAFAAVAAACLLFVTPRLTADDWQQQVRTAVDRHQIPVAQTAVEHRLAEAPGDMEAHSWRGRLLAWTGHWQEAATEFHLVLDQFPNDVDVLTGLADVLLWQQKYPEALAALDVARTAEPRNPEILVRRARVLSLLQRISEARTEYQEVLSVDPANRGALDGLADLKTAPRYVLHIGEEADFFNYTENAQEEAMTLTVHGQGRWTYDFGVSPYHLFGENAVKLWTDAAYRFHRNNWVRVMVSGANPQDVVPEVEGLIEYGHGFRFSMPLVKGLESSFQEHSMWYRGARVLTLSTTQIATLAREWTWTVSLTGWRTEYSGTGSDWVPSGSTKVEFPLLRTLSGNVTFGVGAENFAQVDQIGRLSARTYGGGFCYHFSETQDVTGFVARQDQEHGEKLLSAGLTYGIRF